MKNTMMKSFTVGLILIAMALIPACRSSRKAKPTTPTTTVMRCIHCKAASVGARRRGTGSA